MLNPYNKNNDFDNLIREVIMKAVETKSPSAKLLIETAEKISPQYPNGAGLMVGVALLLLGR